MRVAQVIGISHLFVWFVVLYSTCTAWSPTLLSIIPRLSRHVSQRHRVSLYASSRRHFASQATDIFLGMAAVTSISSVSSSRAVARAASSSEGNVFAEKNFSVQDARQRFQAARKDLRYLIDNYSDISKAGGDAVRNYLGTQGVNSNLYGIQKVLKILQEEANDIVEFTEAMDEFNAYYYQAEGAAYQSLFVEYSSAKGTPEAFLQSAKQDLDQMEKYMDLVAAQIGD
jgi:1,2-phenylacetyl-CoA epoxidase PaaB subunit